MAKKEMQEIALIYGRKDVGGGSTSFTVHLHEGFQRAGIPFKLYRFADAAGKPSRTLAKYEGVRCTYITPDEAKQIVKRQPSVLLAPEHSRNLPEDGILATLVKLGMRLVIHDPNEFQVSKRAKEIYDHLQDRSIIKRPICIRPSMKTHFKDAVFIPHPYARAFDQHMGDNLSKRRSACSIARLTFVKRPTIIMDANRLLPEELRIAFHGAENRLFTYTKLLGKYPEFTQGGYNLPLAWHVSARMAAQYRFAVDMTYFPEDGGGSQYTFMEAWDAGAVNVIHQDWLRYKGEMVDGENCIAVDGPEMLARIIESAQKPANRKRLQEISARGTAHLIENHDPATVARAYYKELTR